MRFLWHYAAWARLPAMVESGELKGSNAGAPDELPMLWFSANQQWEPTATKLMQTQTGALVCLTFKQQAEHFGCIRFGLDESDSRLLNWKDACAAAGTRNEMKRLLEKSGKKQGAKPDNWYASAINIPLSELHFQVWVNRWMNAASIQAMADEWTKHVARKKTILTCT